MSETERLDTRECLIFVDGLCRYLDIRMSVGVLSKANSDADTKSNNVFVN